MTLQPVGIDTDGTVKPFDKLETVSISVVGNVQKWYHLECRWRFKFEKSKRICFGAWLDFDHFVATVRVWKWRITFKRYAILRYKDYPAAMIQILDDWRAAMTASTTDEKVDALQRQLDAIDC